MVTIGMLILDRDMKVTQWNRWMEMHSKISRETIIGSSIFEFFPNLNNSWFTRNCKTVFSFGNFSFASQKLHKYLFPLKSTVSIENVFEFMQQNCIIGPLRNENNQITHIFITVHDVTDIVIYEKKLIEMNTRDELTGAFNRRYLSTIITYEFERSKRYKRPSCLIMIDLDYFKKINDTYGHLTGDFVLKTVAQILNSTIRNIDILTRYGGEEFCCLLPETSIENAIIVAERLRKHIEEHEFNFDNKVIKITISCGVSEVKESIPDVDTLIKNADEALYKAKANGRNQVVNG